jgi:3',5'-cyclic AMP phosphodiesterase CpdA
MARRFIKELLRLLGLDVNKLLLIPGNHDIGWDRRDPQPEGLNPDTTRLNYDNFLELVYGKEMPSPLMMTLKSKSAKTELRIVGVESNLVESRDAAGIGYVLPSHLLDAARKYIEAPYRRKTGTVAAWLIVHHHLFPVTTPTIEEASKKEISVMANASEILTLAAWWGVEMILHGHEHRPSVTVAHRWPVEIGGGLLAPVVCVGAGSCGASQHLGPNQRNQYNIILRRPNAVTVRSRWWSESLPQFVMHDDITLPDCTRTVKEAKPTVKRCRR